MMGSEGGLGGSFLDPLLEMKKCWNNWRRKRNRAPYVIIEMASIATEDWEKQ